MRSTVFAMAFAGSVLILGNTSDNADPLLGATMTTVPQAPIGHLQPRAQPFSRRSASEQVEQQQLSKFDAEQRKLDQELDKSLNICRC